MPEYEIFFEVPNIYKFVTERNHSLSNISLESTTRIWRNFRFYFYFYSYASLYKNKEVDVSSCMSSENNCVELQQFAKCIYKRTNPSRWESSDLNYLFPVPGLNRLYPINQPSRQFAWFFKVFYYQIKYLE